MRTALLGAAALASAALALGAPSASAAGWTGPAVFEAGGKDDEPAPRAGVAFDGTSLVAWRTGLRGLVASAGSRTGRFGAPRTLTRRRVFDWSVAAAEGGAALVAFQSPNGLWVAVRTAARRPFRLRRVIAGRGSPINGVQVAADPLGGWVVAERRFSKRSYSVGALSLDPEGRRAGPVQDFGLGEFGIDARPTQALAVDPDGRALLVFRREIKPPGGTGETQPVMLAVRPHGGEFEQPVELPGELAEPRVTVGAGRVLVTATRTAGCGDAGCFGGPGAGTVGPDGTPGPVFGPPLPRPNRAFAPWAVATGSDRSVLVFQLKNAPAAFSRRAPVRAVALRLDGTTGALQTLTSRHADEPVALPLAGGRALAVWGENRRMGAALAGRDGRFRGTDGPPGPPPEPFHTNQTNRDARAAGRYALVTWSRAGRVRISLRRF